MPHELSPVHQMVLQKTLSGSDTPGTANFGTCFQTTADALHFLQMANLFCHTCLEDSGGAVSGTIVEHLLSGKLIACGTTEYQHASRLRGYFSAGTAYYASPTLTTPIVAAYAPVDDGGGTPCAILGHAGNQYIWRTDATGGFSAQATMGSEIDSTVDMVWCPGSKRFIIVGPKSGGPDCVVKVTMDGSAFSNPASGGNSTVAPPGGIGCDGNFGLLITQYEPGTSGKWCAYSSDGGFNWTWTRMNSGSLELGSVPAYDATRNIWLVTERQNNGDVYSSPNPPTQDSWTKVCDSPGAGAANGIIVIGSTWVHRDGYISFDGGTTWEGLYVTPQAPRTVDGRLHIQEGSVHYLTGRVA